MLCKYIFWALFLFIFYTYAGYPLLLFLLSKFFTKPIKKNSSNVFPAVSVLVAAKNEEQTIGPRLDNLLAQTYPKEKLEILVISDGSTDSTNRIVLECIDITKETAQSIKLLALESSKGKPNALNQGIKSAKGEFIIFADSRQKFENNVIEELIGNFNDPEIGCVSGELLFVKDTDSNIKKEMGLYWKIEKIVRKLESSIGSVAGATGAIYAIRKSLYQELPTETLLDDVLTPMNIVLQGYRTIFDSNACAYDIPSKDTRQEWIRKVRTLSGNWQFLNIKPTLFSPLHNPIWWRFLSHKIFRLFVPFCLPLLFILSFLIGETFYFVLAALQVLFYVLAATGWLIPKTRSFRLINICFFFVVMNLAAFYGFVYWVTGKCNKAWKPSTPLEGQRN